MNKTILSLILVLGLWSCEHSTSVVVKTKDAASTANTVKPEANAFCYITDGNTKLFMEKDENKGILWYFTVGDVIEIVNDSTGQSSDWYKVNFKGGIKAGYDGLRAMNPDSINLTGYVRFDNNIRCE